MEILFEDVTIKTEKIVRLYPAVVINLPEGETAEVSLKWAEMKYHELDIKGFVIVFDLGQLDPTTRHKESFFYDNFTDFEAAMHRAIDIAAPDLPIA